MTRSHSNKPNKPTPANVEMTRNPRRQPPGRYAILPVEPTSDEEMYVDPVDTAQGNQGTSPPPPATSGTIAATKTVGEATGKSSVVSYPLLTNLVFPRWEKAVARLP